MLDWHRLTDINGPKRLQVVWARSWGEYGWRVSLAYSVDDEGAWRRWHDSGTDAPVGAPQEYAHVAMWHSAQWRQS